MGPAALLVGTGSGILLSVATCSYTERMLAVGIRELKNKLSHYVRLVEAGESVLVTDRGTVVAELHPPGRSSRPEDRSDLPPGLIQMAREGRARLGAPHDPSMYPPRMRLLPEGMLERILDEVKADRDPWAR